MRLRARLFKGVRRCVLIVESVFPNGAFIDGRGINTLTGAEVIAPFVGAAVHDHRVLATPARHMTPGRKVLNGSAAVTLM